MKIKIELNPKEDRCLPILYGCELANVIIDIRSILRDRIRHEELTDDQRDILLVIQAKIFSLVTDKYDIPLTVFEDDL